MPGDATRANMQPRQPLPLAARRAAWERVWDRLLMPEDLRDVNEIPPHAQKDVPPDVSGGAQEGR